MGALEDTLFSWQINQAGYRIAAAFEVAAEHHFDEDHLSRAAFLHDAEKRARSVTYLRYHWLHLPASDWTHRKAVWQFWRQPHLLIAKRMVALWLWRGLHWAAWHRAEGITKREFYLIMSIYRVRQYLVERQRPPNYEKHGLRKRKAPSSPAGQ